MAWGAASRTNRLASIVCRAQRPRWPTGTVRSLNSEARPPAEPPQPDQPPSKHFIVSQTAKLVLPFIPTALHLALPGSSLHGFTELDLASTGLPPPFWAFLWPGGAALTRYVAEQGKTGRWKGKRVLDLGSGCGSASIAAVLEGAEAASANDIDPWAAAALECNVDATCELLPPESPIRGELKSRIRPLVADLLSPKLSDSDLSRLLGGHWPPSAVLVGDLFYDGDTAVLVIAFLRRARNAGAEVLIGDPGRWAFKGTHDGADLEVVAEYPLSELDGAVEENDGWRSVHVYGMR
ncbi:hypothetical protein DFJ74DRAFT_505154 [Hyaloraphidium curvatum]|nr:hypothetical protein DFJ74DRAFT_505154 [Hyaloraphidium curvatum]